MQPKTLSKNKDYNNWMALHLFIEACAQWMSENKNWRYDVAMSDTYFDFGQKWMWTTIVITDEVEDSHWQGLSPRDWKLIITCDSVSKITDMAWYFMDNIANNNICVNLYEKFE